MVLFEKFLQDIDDVQFLIKKVNELQFEITLGESISSPKSFKLKIHPTEEKPLRGICRFYLKLHIFLYFNILFSENHNTVKRSVLSKA